MYQDERCIIEGDVGILLFSIENIKPLLSASILSKMVWLLGQSGGPYAALNFPFGKLGNMLFYFGPVFWSLKVMRMVLPSLSSYSKQILKMQILFLHFQDIAVWSQV